MGLSLPEKALADLALWACESSIKLSPMSEKVLVLNIKKEKGYLYFLDADGHVCRVKMEESGRQHHTRPEIVAKAQIIKAPGYLYFIDGDGDVSRSPVNL